MNRILMFSLFTFALLSPPAFGQTSRVYTNLDLGKRLTVQTPVTPEILQGFKAREYRLPTPRPAWPMMMSIGATPSPRAFPEPRPERRLDGTLLSDPVRIYGLPPFPFYFPHPVPLLLQQPRR